MKTQVRARRYRIGDRDRAGGAIGLRILLDAHDVVEFRDGPIRAEMTVGGVVHRILAAQTREIAVVLIGGVEITVGGIDLVERAGLPSPGRADPQLEGAPGAFSLAETATGCVPRSTSS